MMSITATIDTWIRGGWTSSQAEGRLRWSLGNTVTFDVSFTPGGVGCLSLVPANRPPGKARDGRGFCRLLHEVLSRGTPWIQHLHAGTNPSGQPLLESLTGVSRTIYLLHMGLSPISLDAPSRELHRGLAFEDSHDATLLAHLMSQCGAASQDSPELHGRRAPAACLADSENRRVWTVTQWRILLREGQRVGVVGVSHTRTGAGLLTYLGLVPSARRQGLGAFLADEATRLAQAARVERLGVVVDRRNVAAIKLYRRAGFSGETPMSAWIVFPEDVNPGGNRA